MSDPKTPFQSKQLSGLGALVSGGAGPQSPAAKAAADRRTAKAAASAPQPAQQQPPAEPEETTAPLKAVPSPQTESSSANAEPAPAAPRPAPVKRTARKRRSAAHPRFDELERKESRFREDQLEDLASVSKRLQRSKPKGMGGERITDNTLIRVAVDLLLEQADQLTGFTEKEILDSAIKNSTQGDT